MSTLATLLVKLGLDKADYDKGLKDAEQSASTFGGNIVKGLSAVGGAAVVGGFMAAGAAAVGMTVFLKGAVDEAMEAEDGQARLAAVLANTGQATGVTADLVNRLAQEYATMTKFEDDATVAAGAVLARFETISKETFPDALGLTLDLATALGTDASSAATMLGKALVDPGEGLLRLKTAGVSLTDAQLELIDSLVETGDVAGAQEEIMKALEGSIGGMAEAAGTTAAGKMEILKNQFGEVKETIGTALLPAITEISTKITEWLAKPETQEGIQKIAAGIADFGAKVVEWIPQVITWFQNIFTFLSEHQGLIIGILVALGVAIGAFVYTTVIPAAIAMLAALWPILLPILAIIGVVWLLVEAWNNNWFGIRDTLTMVWETYLKPAFETIKAWLGENIPKAIETLRQFWDETLKPAMERIWAFIQDPLIPIFEKVRDWLANELGKAIQTLADFWENTLKPAMEKVWAFIQDPLIPIFEDIWKWISEKVGKALEKLSDLWEKTLKPAMEKVWAFIQDPLLPIFKTFWEFVTQDFIPALMDLKDNVLDKIKNAFGGVRDAIKWVIDKITALITKLKEIKLPAWMQFRSPTPWEMGLRGVADAMKELSTTRLPELEASLRIKGEPWGMGSGSVYNYGGDRFTINNYSAGAAAVTRGYMESRQRTRLNRAMGG